jgi:hypothetical protein
VEDEHGDVDGEPDRTRLVRAGNVRQGERPDQDGRGHAAEEPLEAAGRRAERRREAVEEVREKDEDGEDETLARDLDEARRVVREGPAGVDDERERAEAQRGPQRGATVAPSPLDDGDDGDRREEREIEVVENPNSRAQRAAPSCVAPGRVGRAAVNGQ